MSKCKGMCTLLLEVFVGVGVGVSVSVSGEYALGDAYAHPSVYGVDGCKSCVLNAGGVRVGGCEW